MVQRSQFRPAWALWIRSYEEHYLREMTDPLQLQDLGHGDREVWCWEKGAGVSCIEAYELIAVALGTSEFNGEFCRLW